MVISRKGVTQGWAIVDIAFHCGLRGQTPFQALHGFICILVLASIGKAPRWKLRLWRQFAIGHWGCQGIALLIYLFNVWAQTCWQA